MKLKIVLSFFLSFMLSVFAGSGIAHATGLPPTPVVGTLFTASLIPQELAGSFRSGVYKEVWTGEVIKALEAAQKTTFLEGIRDYSQYVSNVGDEAQGIHMTYFGVEPEVFINNTTYPIPIQELNGEDVIITLDKYQTKATPVTDDELYALAYDKMKMVKDAHGNAISKTKVKKALHALAPGSNTAKMPVLLTTGDDDGTGRKRLTYADLVRFKTALDNLEVPEEGRRLVLCSDHENDLIIADQKFKDQYYNAASGKPYSQFGFEFFSFMQSPYYNPATLAKLSFGAVPAATDRRATIFFSLERASKASGWTKMYYSEAAKDPQMQRNLINFRHHYIVMPTREEGRGAIVSANV